MQKKKKTLETNTLALTLNNHLETIIKINNMIKKIMLASLLLPLCLNAQSVGINTEHPNESAALHINGSQHGEQAVLKATLNGDKISDNIEIINPGRGYTEGDEIFFAGGGASIYSTGRRASANITEVDANGSILKVSVKDAGQGYRTAPKVTILRQKDNLGYVLPRVDLTDVKNTRYPITITDDNADGLWVYNDKQNSNTQTTYWYDKEMSQWHESIPANKTPKFTILSFTGNETHNTTDLATSFHFFKNNQQPFIESISNLDDVAVYPEGTAWKNSVRYNGGDYYIHMPKLPATYLIEVNLNLKANEATNAYAYGSSNRCDTRHGDKDCSKPITSNGDHIMGYFIDLYSYTQSLSVSEHMERKEITSFSKVGDIHKINAVFVLTLTGETRADTSAYKYPFIRLSMGRMNKSSHVGSVEIQKEGSFIKIQQLY